MCIYWGTASAHHFHLKVGESDQVGGVLVITSKWKIILWFVVLGDDQEEKCRSFIELTPGETQGKPETNSSSKQMERRPVAPSKLFSSLSGVLWLSVISEFMYIGLLAMGFLLMWVEAICLCAKREMNALKINAFAAMCTVLSGGPGGHLRIPGGGGAAGGTPFDFDTSVTHSTVISTHGLK